MKLKNLFKKSLTAFFLFLPVSLLAQNQEVPLSTKYAEGEVWAYKTRPGEENSTILINWVEQSPSIGQVFHISVFNIKIKNAGAPNGYSTELPHLPVSKATLEKSLTQKIKDGPINPEYIEGYYAWKERYDIGLADIFTISISEIINTVEKALNP